MQSPNPYTRSTELEYPRVSPGLFLIRSPGDLMYNKAGVLQSIRPFLSLILTKSKTFFEFSNLSINQNSLESF